MAWPDDAKDITYAADVVVPSDNLNEIQDRIVDLHRSRTMVILGAYPDLDGAQNPCWEFQTGASNYWLCDVAQGLTFLIRGIVGYRLSDVEVKYYGGGAGTPAIDLYKIDQNFDSATTAPARGSAIATQYATAHNGAWANCSLTPTSPPETLAADNIFMIDLVPGQIGDRCGGIRVTFLPLTPTP
jgi:hypothetical protein